MASLIYGSLARDIVIGSVDFDTDTFYAMLVTASYTPDQDTHNRRDDITNEVVGTGYTAGGQPTTATVAAYDATNNDVEISFSQVVWSAATITARAAVIYKRRGGASSADELVAYVDFGANINSTADDFTATFSTPLKLQL